MRILQFLQHRNIIQLDIQILIHAFQRPANRNVIFQFHCDFVVHECFEEAEEQHDCRFCSSTVAVGRDR